MGGLPPLPARLNHVQLAALDGAISAFGGHSDSLRDGASVGTSWRCDMKNRRLSEIAPMPTPRAGAGAAVVGGRAYAVGGKHGGAILDNGRVPRPATDRWTHLADMPGSKADFGLEKAGGGLIVLGGENLHEWIRTAAPSATGPSGARGSG